jgi:putative oxygen-independent coproporphyrinogen III oxidase
MAQRGRAETPLATPLALDPPVSVSAARPPVALYVHVPFCLSVCPYCDFVVYAGAAARGPSNRIGAFLDALSAELELRADVLQERFGADLRPLRSVYLGGGTPSLLAAADVAGLLDGVGRRFGIADGAEITLESNPGPLDRGDLAGFRAAGVTRLSLGGQSLDPSELRTLGRRHKPADVAETVRLARDAGFEDVSLDLLYDVPGQTTASWMATLEAAAALEPDHISTYALTLEVDGALDLGPPETADHLPVAHGARAWRMKASAAQDQDRAADMDAIAHDILEPRGFARYEIANWARPGHESRHNLVYWRRLPYEALGPGAHAFDGDRERRWNAANLSAYVAAAAASTLPPGGRDLMDAATARAEGLILGLRLAQGIDERAIGDAEVQVALAWGLANGLLVAELGRLRLTARGRLLSNELFERLLPDEAVAPTSAAATSAAAA